MEQVVDNKVEIDARVESAVRRRFGSGERAHVKKMHDRINFACPFCGDSESDPRKKRANVYYDTLTFCCFNSGCPTPRMDAMSFFSRVGETVSDLDVAVSMSRPRQSRRSRSDLSYGVFSGLQSAAVPMDVVVPALRLVPIADSPFASEYLSRRMVTDWSTFRFCPSDSTLWMFNLTPDGRVMGAQCRTFRGTGPKYVSFNVERLRKMCGLPKPSLEDDDLHRANTLSLFFGILNVDFSAPVTVFEGYIDSTFVPNSMAIAGLTKDTSYLDGSRARFVFDNDQTGIAAARRSIADGKEVFMWSNYLASTQSRQIPKDLNEHVVNLSAAGARFDPSGLEPFFSGDSLDSLWI